MDTVHKGDNNDDDNNNNNTNYTTNTRMVIYQNQSKQIMKVRLPYYGTNKCEPTELLLTINRIS